MYRNEELISRADSSIKEVKENGVCPGESRIKRVFDIIVAAVLLLVLIPMFVCIALCVWVSSPGPVLYTQERVGRGGLSFRFIKFRSMIRNSDEVFAAFLAADDDARAQWETFQKLDRDPRVTRFGRFIRRSSLDELPQLWNVVKGDMSLVGPRPCMRSQQALYGPHWDAYCAVRPGITGLWQVSGRNRLTYAQRVALDSDYVNGWSFRRDLTLLFKTIGAVVRGYGSK